MLAKLHGATTLNTWVCYQLASRPWLWNSPGRDKRTLSLEVSLEYSPFEEFSGTSWKGNSNYSFWRFSIRPRKTCLGYLLNCGEAQHGREKTQGKFNHLFTSVEITQTSYKKTLEGSQIQESKSTHHLLTTKKQKQEVLCFCILFTYTSNKSFWKPVKKMTVLGLTVPLWPTWVPTHTALLKFPLLCLFLHRYNSYMWMFMLLHGVTSVWYCHFLCQCISLYESKHIFILHNCESHAYPITFWKKFLEFILSLSCYTNIQFK